MVGDERGVELGRDVSPPRGVVVGVDVVLGVVLGAEDSGVLLRLSVVEDEVELLRDEIVVTPGVVVLEDWVDVVSGVVLGRVVSGTETVTVSVRVTVRLSVLVGPDWTETIVTVVVLNVQEPGLLFGGELGWLPSALPVGVGWFGSGCGSAEARHISPTQTPSLADGWAPGAPLPPSTPVGTVLGSWAYVPVSSVRIVKGPVVKGRRHIPEPNR